MVHHGDVTGSNELEKVRALFVIGRPLASAEVMTRTTEALFGDYIGMREYWNQGQGRQDPDRAGYGRQQHGRGRCLGTPGSARRTGPAAGDGSGPDPGDRPGSGRPSGRRMSRWISTSGPTCRCPSSARWNRCCGVSWKPGSTG